MPSSEAEEEDPAGLKVNLMQHQRQALAWLNWREQQHPPGGILGNRNMILPAPGTRLPIILHLC